MCVYIYILKHQIPGRRRERCRPFSGSRYGTHTHWFFSTDGSRLHGDFMRASTRFVETFPLCCTAPGIVLPSACANDILSGTLCMYTNEITTHCKTLHDPATYCKTLENTAGHCKTPQPLRQTVVCCNTLQHTARHCNTLQHTATLCHALQR